MCRSVSQLAYAFINIISAVVFSQAFTGTAPELVPTASFELVLTGTAPKARP